MRRPITLLWARPKAAGLEGTYLVTHAELSHWVAPAPGKTCDNGVKEVR